MSLVAAALGRQGPPGVIVQPHDPRRGAATRTLRGTLKSHQGGCGPGTPPMVVRGPLDDAVRHETALRGAGRARVRNVQGRPSLRPPCSPRARARGCCGPLRRAADRPDPPLGDRRRCGARRSVRASPARLRRLHGLRRSLSFIEDFIRDRVLPLYGNTHTEASATGRQTTALREDARRIIHRAVNGGDEDVVLFCGSGMTGAIDKLIRSWPRPSVGPRGAERPVVFVGPYEHHSNELPWRESIADVVTIREDADGRLDLAPPRSRARPPRGPPAEDRQLLRRVERDRHHDRRRRGRDRAAPPRRAGLLGLRHGRAVPADRHEPRRRPRPRLKDAVFLSPHKFVGGPGTPGVLVAKRALFRNPVPSVPGGGTILFVSPTGHRRTTRTRRSARREARRRSSSRSAPGWSSRSRRRSAPRRSGGARAPSPAARSRRGARTRTSQILGNPEPSGSPSSRSASATRAGCSTRTSSPRC